MKHSVQVLEFDERGDVRQLNGAELVCRPPHGVVRWIDIEKPQKAHLDMLSQGFGFHPLTIEDCERFDQRPKLEVYDDYVFLVTHAYSLSAEATKGNTAPSSIELHSFLGTGFLVTVHDEPLEPLNKVWSRLATEPAAGHRGSDFIRYLLADAVVDSLFPLVDQLASRVEELEDCLFSGAPNQATLEEVLSIKRLLATLRKLLSPQRDVIGQLSRREAGVISGPTALYFRNVYDHLLRISESVETQRELLGSILEVYHWTLSQRTNEIMKKLTIVSAIFLPLTFITGFFGQNFESLPFGSDTLMLTMLACCVMLPALMLWFFWRSRWF